MSISESGFIESNMPLISNSTLSGDFGVYGINMDFAVTPSRGCNRRKHDIGINGNANAFASHSIWYLREISGFREIENTIMHITPRGDTGAITQTANSP